MVSNSFFQKTRYLLILKYIELFQHYAMMSIHEEQEGRLLHDMFFTNYL
jgi:hypothetical protein